jgi:mRNA interferase RelE/StbE
VELRPVVRQRIRVAIRRLAHDPRPARAKLLSGPGAERIWRIRVGDYRVLYEIRDERLIVLVIRIAHRRDIYRSG